VLGNLSRKKSGFQMQDPQQLLSLDKHADVLVSLAELCLPQTPELGSQTWALRLLQAPALTCNFTFSLSRTPASMRTKRVRVSARAMAHHCTATRAWSYLTRRSPGRRETRGLAQPGVQAHTPTEAPASTPSSANTSAGFRYTTESGPERDLKEQLSKEFGFSAH